MYPYREASNTDMKSNLAPIPSALNKLHWISDIQLKEKDRKQRLAGTNKSLISPKTDIVVGNIVRNKGELRIPLCQTVVLSKNLPPDYFTKNHCLPLKTTSPKEYTKKWLSLGCPYSIEGGILQTFQPKTFSEIITLRSTEIPYYHSYVQNNAHPTPLTKETYKKIIRD